MRKAILIIGKRMCNWNHSTFSLQLDAISHSKPQWLLSLPIAPFQSCQERCYATAGMESREHATARVVHRAALKDLQTSWRQDNLAFEKEKKDRLVAKNEKIQEEKRARLIRRNEKKEMVANSKARDAIQEESAEEARLLKAAQWRGALTQIHSQLNVNRKEQLIEDSRHWIRAQDLEARIQEALDHPVPLY